MYFIMRERGSVFTHLVIDRLGIDRVPEVQKDDGGNLGRILYMLCMYRGTCST